MEIGKSVYFAVSGCRRRLERPCGAPVKDALNGWPAQDETANLPHMSTSEDEDEGEPMDAGRSDQSESDLLTTGVWHAPRGPKTRAVAWVILIAIAICLVATVVMFAVQVLG